MGSNLSKKSSLNDYREHLFQKISHTDILEYIKKKLSKIKLEIDVNSDYIMFNDKDSDGFMRVIMYPWEQFVEHMAGGEEIDFKRLDKLILEIACCHSKFK